MRRLLPFIGLCLGLYACSDVSLYPGYSVTDTGLNYKIHTIGEPLEVLHDSEVISYDWILSKMNDAVIQTTHTVVDRLYIQKNDTGIAELLGLMAMGDSATAILKGFNGYGFQTADSVKISIKLHQHTPYRQWLFYQKYPELEYDLEMSEQLLLTKILNGYPQDSIEYIGGVFLIHQIVGSGPYPVKGDEVILESIGRTSKGNIIESSKDRGLAFSYVLGHQDQVLEGFDYGVRHLKKGGMATFIIPSKLAFGSKGSSTGIVKPYETIIYEVEMLQIISGNLDTLNKNPNF